MKRNHQSEMHRLSDADRQMYARNPYSKKPKRGKNKFLVICLIIVLSFCGYYVVTHIDGWTNQPVLEQGESADVTIKENATLQQVANLLLDAHVIGNAGNFTSQAKNAGLETTLAPGQYHFEGGQSMDDVINILLNGPNAEEHLVIPEGMTIKRCAEEVEKAYGGMISKSDFENLAKNASAFEEEFPFVKDAYNNSLEGFLFPKSYPLLKSATAQDVIKQMLNQYQQETSGIDYSYAESKGLNKYDVLKLASIIEREASNENRAHVSSVFYNRLAEDMPLQSDATVAYMVNHDPTPDDLKIEGPYNTYLSKGLPAGPICSPGLSCIEAATNPDKTDDLYFYFAEKDGKMKYYFSKDYESHKRAIEDAQ